MENKIKHLLKEIKSILEIIAPEQFHSGMIKHAEEKDITDFENELGEKLPDDYRFFLLNNDFKIDFVYNFECLSLEQMLRQRAGMCKLLKDGIFNDGRVNNKKGNWKNKKIKQVWWSPKWIPFAEDSCGNMFSIDLDPGEKGEKYQIIQMEIQDGQGPCSTKYKSFLDFLEKHFGYLKNKQYIEYNGAIIIDPDTLPQK